MKAKAEEWNSVWSSKKLIHKFVNYARNSFTRDVYKTLFKKYINKNTTLLEVGCGSSTTSLYLAPNLKEFVGIDISEEALSLSRKKAKELGVTNAKFVKGDCFKMPFKDGSFDMVWSQGLLEHFDNPKGILKEKVRVCKKGGRIITSVPALWSIHKAWYVATRPKLLRNMWPWTEQTFYTKQMLNKLVPKGASIEKTYHYKKYGVMIQILRKI